MRHSSTSCDWCWETIQERILVRGSRWLIPAVTWEGARDTYEFCSEECAQAFADRASIDSVPCAFEWEAEDGREKHRHTCKFGLYNGRIGGSHLGCRCECGAHTDRPESWLADRLREHLASQIASRVERALNPPRPKGGK